MYILESIQEFQGKKIGIYILEKLTNRRKQRAKRQLEKHGNPKYAIFISTKKIKKGDHELCTNKSPFLFKEKKDIFIEIITI